MTVCDKEGIPYNDLQRISTQICIFSALQIVLESFSSLFLICSYTAASQDSFKLSSVACCRAGSYKSAPLIINFPHSSFLEKVTVGRYGFMNRLIKRTPSLLSSSSPAGAPAKSRLSVRALVHMP